MRRRGAGRIGGAHGLQRSVPQVTDVVPSAGNPLDVSSDVPQLFVDEVMVGGSRGLWRTLAPFRRPVADYRAR